MKLEYIINAINALDECHEALLHPKSPEETGQLMAACTIAALDLKVYSGMLRHEVEIDYTDYTMRQGEMGSPDRSR